MTDILFYIAYEDELSHAIIRKIFQQLEGRFVIGKPFPGFGFGYLKRNAASFNELAKGVPFLLLTDLDNSECPASKIKEWLKKPLNPNFLFRVAVREIESWVMADRDSFAKFLDIPINRIPTDTDAIEDPKKFLIKLTRRSRNKVLMRNIVPAQNSTASIGKNYNEPLIRFVEQLWDMNRAAKHSESLMRVIKRLRMFG